MIWDNMMWGSDYPRSESTFPRSYKILAEVLESVPGDEQAKPAPDRDPAIAGGKLKMMLRRKKSLGLMVPRLREGRPLKR